MRTQLSVGYKLMFLTNYNCPAIGDKTTRTYPSRTIKICSPESLFCKLTEPSREHGESAEKIWKQPNPERILKTSSNSARTKRTKRRARILPVSLHVSCLIYNIMSILSAWWIRSGRIGKKFTELQCHSNVSIPSNGSLHHLYWVSIFIWDLSVYLWPCNSETNAAISMRLRKLITLGVFI